MEIQKNSYIVNYLDMYEDIIHTDRYNDKTKLEAWHLAENNTPRDRAIETFEIIKINEDGTENSEKESID